jgi:predicted Rossmann-fold nucleotide-binding protein
MKLENPQETFITGIKTFCQFQENGASLRHCTLQALDFSEQEIDWGQLQIDHTTTFLGCQLSVEEELLLRRRGAYVYNAPDSLPYDPFRTRLYCWQELMEGFTETADQSTDLQIYQHFSASKFTPTINEALWQRIHDYSIDEALRDLLQFDREGMSQRPCVGFMGGHSTRRDSPYFANTARTAKLLGEAGYFIATGGGPGIMEAANLGAYFAGQPEENFAAALHLLQQAPHYTVTGYHRQALEVLERFPDGQESLAIPTWFYGHEPSNLFASHIAKYFSNSIREDTLLAVSLYGIVCAPGSAGTTQEIFMDATQNHYGTFNFYSPMVFLGRHRYEIETLIFPLLRQLAWGREYFDLLFITDEPEEVLQFLQTHPPRKVGIIPENKY